MDKETNKLMQNSIVNGNFEQVQELIEKNENLINEVTGFGTWLHISSKHGQLEIVKYLIDKGIDVNLNAGIGTRAAICLAAFKGHLDVVKYLYEHGAKFDVSESTKNPLFDAVYGDHLEIVKYFVENGIDITVRYKTNSLDNEGAYEYARTYGKDEIAEYLKEKLIDTDYFSANRKDHNPLVNR